MPSEGFEAWFARRCKPGGLWDRQSAAIAWDACEEACEARIAKLEAALREAESALCIARDCTSRPTIYDEATSAVLAARAALAAEEQADAE